MTDTTTTTPTADTTEEEPSVTTTPEPTETEHDTANPQAAKARKEAANYRERLRSTEAERDTAHGQIEALQRQLVDGQITATGLKPEAFWAAGVTLADLTAADGSIDPEAVTEAANTARDKLGISRFRGDADQGAARTATTPPTRPEDWGTFLKPKS